MKIFLTLIVLCSSAYAQQAARRPNLFPPVTQLLGAAEPGALVQAPPDFDTLVRRLRAKSPAARIEALNALGAPGDYRAVPYLGAVLLNLDEPVETRVAAAMSLGRVGN